MITEPYRADGYRVFGPGLAVNRREKRRDVIDCTTEGQAATYARRLNAAYAVGQPAALDVPSFDTRYCCVCERPITACFGFCCVRDLLAVAAGTRRHIRELCGICADNPHPAYNPLYLYGPWYE